MKENTKTTITIMGIIIVIPFLVYFLIAEFDWFSSDPFNIIADEKRCEYEIIGQLKCVTKEKYCRDEVRKMFVDLNDTWGSDTNNQDQISKTMSEIYNKCIETE